MGLFGIILFFIVGMIVTIVGVISFFNMSGKFNMGAKPNSHIKRLTSWLIPIGLAALWIVFFFVIGGFIEP